MNESCTVCHGTGRLADVATMHAGLVPIPDVNASIDSVSIDVDDEAETATLTVNFTVTDPDGKYIPGLGAPSSRPDRFAYLRFALSELEPPAEGSGDPDIWVSYTTGDRNPANLTDHGDGTYTYVFGTNLYELYMPDLTHRLLLMVYGDIVAEAMNVTYDFVPDQLPGPFTFDITRDIVTTAACDSCHGRLGSPLGNASFHGGSRYTAEACTVCHTTTLGGGAAEFAPMVHGIHSAQDIEDLADFSEVTYPQDLRNCAKCHAGPDGGRWNTRPTITACGSCHTNVDFATGEGHVGGIQTNNSRCSLCHPSEAIVEYHLTENSTPNNPLLPDDLVTFEYVLDDVTVNESNEAVVTFHINKDGEPVDLTTVYPPEGFSGGPSFLVAYALPQDGIDDPADYNNRGRTAGQPASVSIASVAGSLTGTPESYTAVLSSAAFPEGASLRAVALQGYFTQLGSDPNSTSDDVARHTYSVVKAVTGDEVRREVVDVNKCLDCHEIIEAHGGNRVSNPQVCAVCHNPNLSSSGRTVDPAQIPDATREALDAAGYDGSDPLTWPEATNNLKDMIHGIHAAAVRNFPYEFVRNRNNGIYYNWSEVTFPGILTNCETCHMSGTYDADLPMGALVTTDITTNGINTREDILEARANVPNPTDLIDSPIASTCYKCHDSNPAAAHFGQNGGVLDTERAEALGE